MRDLKVLFWVVMERVNHFSGGITKGFFHDLILCKKFRGSWEYPPCPLCLDESMFFKKKPPEVFTSSGYYKPQKTK